MFKKLLSLFLAILTVLVLASCGGKRASETSPADSGNVNESSTESNTEQSDELFGKPWINSIVTGNLPEKAPEVKDDLYLYFNYEEICAHQGEIYSVMTSNASVISDYLADKIEEGTLSVSESSAYSDAELDALKIFYMQAADLKKLEEIGMSELQPYLDRIKNAETLEELNGVLVSDDFPFCPYLDLLIGAYSMAESACISVYPELLFVDNIEGSVIYQPSDDEEVENAHMQAISEKYYEVIGDLTRTGMTQEEATEATSRILAFEKSYGKDAASYGVYSDKSFGEYGAAKESLSLDELAALCPNFPVIKTIEKFGKDRSGVFSVMKKDWLASFNQVWTEENLETLKLVTEAKIIHECAPYLDTGASDLIRTMTGKPALDARTNAISACDRNEAFAHLLGKIYVSDNFTEKDIDNITSLAEELIDSSKELLAATSWLNDGSREKMLEKLDNMRLNILSPDGGYIDFGDLRLTPSEEGGTLLSNYFKVKAYINEKNNEKIGKPAEARIPWECYTPSVVNCFYDPDSNSINVMPGFAATDMYRTDMTDEELLGAIGWVIAHEISHGFDFAGGQFDAYGVGNSIIDEDDIQEYLSITERLVGYLDKVEALPGVFVSGNSIKVEAGADLIGLELVMDAAKKIDRIFDYKSFFRQTAAIYCMVTPSQDIVRMLMESDAHPLNYLRTNVCVQMFDELYETYGIREGDGMYLKPEDRIVFFGQ